MERSPLKAPKESDVTPPAVEGSLEFDEDTLKAMERSPLKAPKESDVTPPAVEGSLEFDEDTLKVMGRSPIKAAKESDVTPPAVEGSLEFDDDTFKAIAEVYFQEGNKKYREKEFINAIHFYTEGIEVNCKDSVKNAKMYSNRATAHFQLGPPRQSIGGH